MLGNIREHKDIKAGVDRCELRLLQRMANVARFTAAPFAEDAMSTGPHMLV